ncbi:MAG: hypothetical protein GEV13_10710 [Rhodospirillales bacterium]|nr:hypothetical protein [Rhodospirillales bacterium]
MFVDRRDGAICGLHHNKQHDGQEELPDDAAEIADYLESVANPVPGQVSAGQLIQALAGLELLDGVDAAVAQANAMTQRLWARAAFFPRQDPMVLAIASAVGQTSEQMDELFRLAATK